jgi:hypothetical protein
MKRLSGVLTAIGATTARRWWTSFSIVLLLSLCWSLATPLFASPDEPAHVSRAASVARGQLLGRTPPHDPHGQLLVKVPAIFERGNNVSCFAFSPNTTAKCLSFSGSTRTVEISTTAGRHPPLYYAAVGWPSLPFASAFGVRLMRIVTAALAAALLACAVTAVLSLRSRRLAALGLAVAVTPMVLFLNGVVNPSAVEIAAATCLWSAGIVLVVDPGSEIRPTLITYVGVGACALALARQLGPLWLGITGLLLAWVGGGDVVRGLLRSRRFVFWVGAAAVSSVLQLAWVLSVGTLDAANGNTPGIQHAGLSVLIRGSVGRAFLYYRELIGVFGWRDTSPPSLVLIVWTAAIGGIAVLGVWLGTRRSRQVMLTVAVLAVVLPVFFEVLDAHKAGYFWQGRYTLPLAVGIPIVGAVTAAESEGASRLDAGRLAWTFAIGLGAAHVLAFGQALRRYTVGANSYLNIFTGTPWGPPGSAALLCAAFLVATAAWFGWLFAGVRSGADGTPVSADGAARSSPVEASTAPIRSRDPLRAPR